MILPIGLSGNAVAGKDSLYECLNLIFKEYNIQSERFALADFLKIELAEFTKTQYGISILTKDIREKTLIRPLMVEHGRARRTMSQGRYWVDYLTPKIKESLKNNIVPIVTDIRYAVYEKDELSWIREELGGYLIYIERVLPNGSLVPPANIDEQENNLKLAQVRDFYLKWPTTTSLEERLSYVRVQLKELIDKIVD